MKFTSEFCNQRNPHAKLHFSNSPAANAFPEITVRTLRSRAKDRIRPIAKFYRLVAVPVRKAGQFLLATDETRIKHGFYEWR
jgi:hypothetical protein